MPADGPSNDPGYQQARERLGARGIDPDHLLGLDDFGADVSVAGLYLMLGMVAATERITFA